MLSKESFLLFIQNKTKIPDKKCHTLLLLFNWRQYRNKVSYEKKTINDNTWNSEK